MSKKSDAALRIGTRSSPLALAQADETIDLLSRQSGSADDFDLVKFVSTGDQILDRPLADIGGKGLFSKELDAALAEGAIDAAVHSAKDLETELPDGIVIGGVLPREDPSDMLISDLASTIKDLPNAALVGTSSVRRAAQILNMRPDILIKPIRGNVDTRLRKLREGDCQATILAAAGLNRLGRKIDVAHTIPPSEFVPASGQGIIAITCRADDQDMLDRLEAVSDSRTFTALICERAVLAALDGSCRTPIGAFAELSPGGDKISLSALNALEDGTRVETLNAEGVADDAVTLGTAAGEELKARYL